MKDTPSTILLLVVGAVAASAAMIGKYLGKDELSISTLLLLGIIFMCTSLLDARLIELRKLIEKGAV